MIICIEDQRQELTSPRNQMRARLVKIYTQMWIQILFKEVTHDHLQMCGWSELQMFTSKLIMLQEQTTSTLRHNVEGGPCTQQPCL